MNVSKLSEFEIEAQLSKLQQWRLSQGKLTKKFCFGNFHQAFGFATQVAIVSEKMNHHPSWYQDYREVTFYLYTWSVKGISCLDFKLAEKMDEIYQINFGES